MSRVYWSIDLDFWAKCRNQFSLSFFDDLLRRRIPIHVVKHHHHLLHYIPKYEFDILVNTDWHSDLADDRDLRWDSHSPKLAKSHLNEGTWLNYVPGKENKVCIWHYPRQDCMNLGSGLCHWEGRNPFICGKKQHYQSSSGWQVAMYRKRCEPLEDDGTIVAVGISVSPGWCDMDHFVAFKGWCQSNRKRITLRRGSFIRTGHDLFEGDI